MKSGLEGRNKLSWRTTLPRLSTCLNEVRPRRPEQTGDRVVGSVVTDGVSMKSGLEGRNKRIQLAERAGPVVGVSMKSGLEGRNKRVVRRQRKPPSIVSMKSGLEGRNKRPNCRTTSPGISSLNEVRPRRPEQT